MYRLIDRGTGDELGTISESDLQAFLQVLVSESEDDRDFFVTSEALDLLAGQPISPDSLQVLKEVLSARGDRDIGWEPLFTDSVRRITTRLVGDDGSPLPGLRGELRADEEDADEIAWAFSRADGTLTIGLDAQEVQAIASAPLVLTILATGTGESPLVDVEVEPLGESDRELEDVALPLMQGRLLGRPDDAPLAGVLVEVLLLDDGAGLDFTTSTVTNAAGEFRFPYPPVASPNPSRSRLELELVAPSWEPLEYLNVEGALARPQLGDHRINPPDPDWQPSEEARASLEVARDALYPGVDPHPLK